MKYNPKNHTPELFLRPPTNVVEGELAYLARQLEHTLVGNNGKPRKLRIGTEFEINFFREGSDPATDLHTVNNPNYSKIHLDNMEKVNAWADRLERLHPDRFQHSMRFGRVMIEFRTAPQSLSDYLSTVSWFRDQIASQTKQYSMLPVVHSQHIHISCVQGNSYNPARGIDENSNFFKKIRHVFSHGIPLMALPHEYGSARSNMAYPAYFKGDGVKGCPQHVEFRLLSSEYAADPVLNVVFSMFALFHGLDRRGSIEFNRPNIYENAVKQFANDPEMQAFFGQSTCAALARVIRHYPDVSRRNITVSDIHVRVPRKNR